MRRLAILPIVLLLGAAVATTVKPHPSTVQLPRPFAVKPKAVATPALGTAAALIYSTSADLRIVSDAGAYGPDDATSKANARTELQYLGVAHARTDFTCDQAIWGGGCDPRNLVSTYLNTFPADYWIVLPFTSGAVVTGDVTGFQIPNLTHYGNTIHAIEVGNEANNVGSFTYNGVNCGNGGSTWAGCTAFAADYYAQSQTNFPGIPVFSWSNPFAMPDNVLLQFVGSFTPSTHPVLADYADVHNYIQGNGYSGPVDFVVTQAFETGSGGSDNGMSGNFCGNTVAGNFPAVPVSMCPQVPRVTTETGVEFGSVNTTEEARAAMLVNAYIIGYIRGWTLVSIYAVADDTTNFGLFQNANTGTVGTPYQAATAIHNFTTILNDPIGAPFTPITTCPSITGNVANTDYVLCGQMYNGTDWLIATGDRPQGEHVETWNLGIPTNARVFDTFAGTASIGNSNVITVDDHPIIVLWNVPSSTPTPTVTATSTPFTPTPTPSPSGVPSMTVTPTPTMVPTLTPTATPTVLPTPTATPTAPTPTPTATPTPVGGFDFPNNPTFGQVVVGPIGQKFKWDGQKWIVYGITSNKKK